MDSLPPDPTPRAADGPPRRGPFAAWLAWTWVALIGAALLAELFGIEALRLALDFGRHLR